MSKNTIAVVAGLALAGVAGFVGYQVYKSKKETNTIRAKALKEVAAIEAQTEQKRREYEEEMVRVRAARERNKKNHDEVMAALEAARKAGNLEHRARLQILTDMAAKKITPAEAVLRLSASKRRTAAAKTAVAKAQKRVPRLHAVA